MSTRGERAERLAVEEVDESACQRGPTLQTEDEVLPHTNRSHTLNARDCGNGGHIILRKASGKAGTMTHNPIVILR